MRAFAAIVAALCTFAFAMPVQAFGLAFCDDIKDDQSRMACLQEHISHLEETIVALSGRIATVENALDHKLGAEVTYKFQAAAGGKCLGIAGDPPSPSLADCDSEDSWKMLAGAPIKKPEKPAPPPPPTPESQSDPANARSPAAADQASKPANPCRGLDQVGCTAKPNLCAWKPDKNKCGRK
jgi:hypothetical protein